MGDAVCYFVCINTEVERCALHFAQKNLIYILFILLSLLEIQVHYNQLVMPYTS
jgi:hypothetical protein